MLRISLRIVFSAALLGSCAGTASAADEGPLPRPDTERGTLTGSPLDHLPKHIQLISRIGMRPDWSPDQKQLAYLDKPLGQIYLFDFATRTGRNISAAFPNFGFLRAHFLVNGDLLLCGPARKVPPSDAGAGRSEGVMWVYRAPFTAPPQALGTPCWEGLAVSRNTLRVAWNRSNLQLGSAPPKDFYSEIWTGEIGYDARGQAYLSKVAKVLDRSQLPFEGVVEAQNFRGDGDIELILTGYGLNCEVMGYNLSTGELRNYSNSPVYEEAEGVAPDGKWMLVERNIETTYEPGALDIWRLWLDGGHWERMTHFNRYRGEKYPVYASNPVVSPDGKRFAFQMSIDGTTEGEGNGVLIYELSD
jgi:hypothetical protein